MEWEEEPAKISPVLGVPWTLPFSVLTDATRDRSCFQFMDEKTEASRGYLAWVWQAF